MNLYDYFASCFIKSKIHMMNLYDGLRRKLDLSRNKRNIIFITEQQQRGCEKRVFQVDKKKKNQN